MVDGQLCERCRVRPAVAEVRRVHGGMPPEVERLCEVCLQEGQLSPGSVIRRGLFDEFFSDLFGGRPGAGIPVSVPHPIQQVDITQFFSDATRRALQQAAQRAAEWGSDEVDTDHVLWALLPDEGVARILGRADGDPAAMAQHIEQEAPRGDSAPETLPLAPDTKRVLLAAYEEARALRASYIGPEHILLAMTRDADSRAGRVLERFGATHQAVGRVIVRGLAPEREIPEAASTTPTLDRHSRDLTELAHDGKLDPVIGRADEIDQTIEVLSRRTKNNPVLIGDPGVGKTAIVEGIAQRIITGEVPETLENKRLVALDLAGMLAGTRYRGEFEQRLTQVIEEITRESGRMVLFVDEMHTIVGAGAAEGAMDAANMLKPALARGDLHLIGATTLDEYRKNVERDAALERRFQPIVVEELSVPDTVQVLLGLKDRYEAFHRVRITDEAIVAAAELSDRYVMDRFLPDKAIDLMDQAAARVRLRRRNGAAEIKELEGRLRQLRREKDQAVAVEEYDRAAELKVDIRSCEEQLERRRNGRHPTVEVTAEDIAEVVGRATGIPVAQLTQDERDRMLRLEERLHGRVVGQDEAVQVVSEAIRRNRAGLGDPNRPVGSFLFLGPTGVGKTELARTLAEALFGDDEHMIRLDMSEFQERHTVSRLVGAPPGYVGYEEAGQLTEQVRRRPYAVLLLDEVEKAHPDVFNLLLQVLDEGRLTDAQGRTVNFRNAVVIMTSNFGADRIQATGPSIGFRATMDRSAQFETLRDDLMNLLRRNFRPEFLNRIDEIVVFRPLTREQLLQITRLLLDGLSARLRARGIEVRVTDDAVARLADRGYDPDFGARPLRRTIQRLVENELSRMVLGGALEEGDRVTVGRRNGELTFDVAKGVNDEERVDNWEERQAPPAPQTAGPGAPRR